MVYNPKDYFFHKAKEENYAARSVFKLQEIDQRLKILKPGYKILDLGAAPGSWSQFSSERVGIKGRVLGVDIQPIKITLQNAVFITADMKQLDLNEVMIKHGITPPFDVVLSDMAPKTSGIKINDQMRSLELCELALKTADRFLRPGGSFVCKIFQSGEMDDFKLELRKRFKKVEIIRPKSTRRESKEFFFVALQYTPPKPPTPPKAAPATPEKK
jgi:23S rRNA (uridine2552-2'-O)-methyltransferase